MLKRTLMIATLAVAVSGPAFASTKAEDCRGMKNGAAVLIGIADMLNDDFKRVSDPSDKDQAEADNLRRQFNVIVNKFLSLKQEYSRRPCGSGDLEKDLGDKFPTLGKAF